MVGQDLFMGVVVQELLMGVVVQELLMGVVGQDGGLLLCRVQKKQTRPYQARSDKTSL